MGRKIRVLNLSRTTKRVGRNNIAPASSSVTPSVIDVADGKTRKALSDHGDSIVVLGEEEAIQTVVVPLVPGGAGGNVLSWANPTGKRIHVRDVALDVTTVSTGVATLDVCTATVSATTTGDNLIDGKDVNAATGLFSSLDGADNGTNGKEKGQPLAAGKWVTGTSSAATTGLVGNALITYVVAE